MFYRRINESLALSLLVPEHAPSLFELTDKNRSYLRKWLPWVGSTVREEDTERFIKEQYAQYCEKKALNVAIEFEQNIVGVIAYNQFDLDNNIGEIGYWLGEEYAGKGLMTLAVKEMISIGFDDYSLNRVEIQCATENIKSRAIPERLGFMQEGILRQTEKVNGVYLDHAVYGLLSSDVKL
jgi:ribosomal-protein-serine acetyltransferase